MAGLENERFIHDILIERVASGLRTLYDEWKKEQKIPPFFLTWPATTVYDHQGEPVNDICRLDLSEVAKKKWHSAFMQSVQLTQAYAILLCEQRERDVRVILESVHGTRVWTLPIERHGDISVLGPASTEDDTDYIGLLWRPNRAQS